MATTLPYYEQKDIENIKKLREMMTTLPPFCTEFFRGIDAKSADTHAVSKHRDIGSDSCLSAFLCSLLYCFAQKRLICYLDTSLSRSTWIAAATAATTLMPNSNVFLITFIGSPPFLICVEQLTGHFVEQGRIVEHFLNLLLRAAVVE